MTDHLVIGGNGLIGTALCAKLESDAAEYIATTRRPDEDFGTRILYRIDRDLPAALPEANVVYLVAAMPGFAACEGNAESWLVNVDAQIAIARRFKDNFVVYISSDAVEWCGGTAYARQKAQVESYINAIDGAIMRPSRVVPVTVANFAAHTVRVGTERLSGVHRWKS